MPYVNLIEASISGSKFDLMSRIFWGDDPDMTDGEGKSALHHLALRAGDMAHEVLYLLSEGAQWDLRDTPNRTPGFYAFDVGNHKIASIFAIRHGRSGFDERSDQIIPFLNAAGREKFRMLLGGSAPFTAELNKHVIEFLDVKSVCRYSRTCAQNRVDVESYDPYWQSLLPAEVAGSPRDHYLQFRRDASSEDLDASAKLATDYLKGNGVDKNVPYALQMLEGHILMQRYNVQKRLQLIYAYLGEWGGGSHPRAATYHLDVLLRDNSDQHIEFERKTFAQLADIQAYIHFEYCKEPSLAQKSYMIGVAILRAENLLPNFQAKLFLNAAMISSSEEHMNEAFTLATDPFVKHMASYHLAKKREDSDQLEEMAKEGFPPAIVDTQMSHAEAGLELNRELIESALETLEKDYFLYPPVLDEQLRFNIEQLLLLEQGEDFEPFQTDELKYVLNIEKFEE